MFADAKIIILIDWQKQWNRARLFNQSPNKRTFNLVINLSYTINYVHGLRLCQFSVVATPARE